MKYNATTRVEVRTGTVGPKHDPYNCTTVIVRRGQNEAHLYTDGLGQCRAHFKDEKAERGMVWFDHECLLSEEERRSFRQNMLKAQLLARRTVGLRFDEAEDFFHSNYRPDLMGNFSRYI